MNGPSPSVVWTGELWSYYGGIPTGDYARRILAGGRGYGKNAALDGWRRAHKAAARLSIWLDEAQRFIDQKEQERAAVWNTIDDALLRPVKAPGIAGVRWSCKRPTAPVYTPGQAGWYDQKAYAILRGELTMASVVAEARAYQGRITAL